MDDQESLVKVGDWFGLPPQFSGGVRYFNIKSGECRVTTPREFLDPRLNRPNNCPSRTDGTVVGLPSNLSSLQALSDGSTLSAKRVNPPNAQSYKKLCREDLVDNVKGQSPEDALEYENSSTKYNLNGMDELRDSKPESPECASPGQLHDTNADSLLLPENKKTEESKHRTNSGEDKMDNQESLVKVGDWFGLPPQFSGGVRYFNIKSGECRATTPREFLDPRLNRTNNNYPSRTDGTVVGLPSDLSSLQALSDGSAISAKRVNPPNAQSYKILYREDLVDNVRGQSPEDALEYEAHEHSKKAHVFSRMRSRVSAELKVARINVQIAETQAARKERRLSFLRQQTEELEAQLGLNFAMEDDA